jgi:hypothetical protein
MRKPAFWVVSPLAWGSRLKCNSFKFHAAETCWLTLCLSFRSHGTCRHIGALSEWRSNSRRSLHDRKTLHRPGWVHSAREQARQIRLATNKSKSINAVLKRKRINSLFSRQSVLKSQPNNVLISPLSVKVLLTLLAEAAGQTVDSKTRKVSEHCDAMQVLLPFESRACLGY